MPKCPKCNKEVYFGECAPLPPARAPTAMLRAAPPGSAAQGPTRGAAQVGRGRGGTLGTGSERRLRLYAAAWVCGSGALLWTALRLCAPPSLRVPLGLPVSGSPRLWVSCPWVSLTRLLWVRPGRGPRRVGRNAGPLPGLSRNRRGNGRPERDPSAIPGALRSQAHSDPGRRLPAPGSGGPPRGVQEGVGSPSRGGGPNPGSAPDPKSASRLLHHPPSKPPGAHPGPGPTQLVCLDWLGTGGVTPHPWGTGAS